MSIAKRATNNIFWLFISEICAKVAMFLGTLYLARVLGVEGFGLYSLAIAVAMYLWTVVAMGVVGYGTREVARDKDRAEDLLTTLNSLRFMAAVVSFLLLGVILFVLELPHETRWVLLAGGFYVVGFALSPDWVFKGIERMEYIAIGNITIGIAFLGSIYFLVRSPADTALATFFRSLAFLLGSLVTLIILKRKTGVRFSFKFTPSKWRMHLKESWYFAVNAGLSVIGKFIPLFFLGIWASNEEIGLFSAPHRFILLIMGVAMILPNASYPILSSLYVTNKDKFIQTHRSFQKLALYVGLPSGILGMLLSRDIITLLYGSSYLKATGILKIIVWVIPLIFLRLDYGRPLVSAGFQNLNMFANGGGAVITVLLCLPLVRCYGGHGAALAVVGGELTSLVLMGLMFMVKLYRCNPFDLYFFKVLLSSILTGIVVSNIELPVLLKIISGLGVYGILSLIMGVISWESISKIYQGVVLPNLS